jgi:hypothetical protein
LRSMFCSSFVVQDKMTIFHSPIPLKRLYTSFSAGNVRIVHVPRYYLKELLTLFDGHRCKIFVTRHLWMKNDK